MKWVEYLQSFTFFIKHKSGVTNRFSAALSRRHSLLTKMKVEVLGFDEMKEFFVIDPDVFEVWIECTTPNLIDHITKYDEYFIQESMFLKGILFSIPRISMWLNLIEEKHSDGLARDRTLSLLKDKYYWPKMYKDAQNFVNICGVCQVAKGVSQNNSLYTTISIP